MPEQNEQPIPVPGFQDMLDQHQVEDAKQKATQSFDRVHRQDQALSERGTGTDPDFVSTIEHFEGMEHQALYDAVHGPGGLDAAGLQTLRQVWYDCYSELNNLTAGHLMGLGVLFNDGLWEGASADAAQVAMKRFADAAGQISQVFGSVSSRLDAAAWAAEAVKAAVPPPPATVQIQPDPDNPVESVLPGLANGEYVRQLDDAREQARLAAVAALNTVYKSSFPPVGSGVPTYTDVPRVGDSSEPSVVGDSGSAGGGSSPAPATSEEAAAGAPGTESGAPGATESSASQGVGDSAAGADPSATQAANSAVAPNIPSTSAPGSSTAGSLPGDRTPLSSPTPGTTGYIPNPGSRATPSPGGTGNSAGQNRVGQPGQTRSAVPGSGTSAAAGSSGSPSRPTRTTPMGPMAPGAARSRDDDQKEHHSPDYLRRVHDDWLAGISALPPVLGDSGSADPDMPDPATAPDVEDMPADPPSRSARLHSYYRDDTPPSVHQPATAPAPAGSAEAATSEEPQSLPEAEELPQPQHIDLTDQTPLDERQLPQQDGVTTVSVSGTGPFATHTADSENPSGR